MKKLTFYGLMLVSAVLFFSCNNEKNAVSQPNFSLATDSTGVVLLPIAYVNVDTLLFNYEFAKDMNESVLRKQEDARLNLNQKMSSAEKQVKDAQSKFEKEVKDFQEKVEKQIFTTPERAQSEQARLVEEERKLQALSQRLAQELQISEQKLTQEMLAEQQKINAQLKDSLNAVIAIYNADKHYQMILSNDAMGNTILFAEQQYNITADILTLLNSRYTKPAK